MISYWRHIGIELKRHFIPAVFGVNEIGDFLSDHHTATAQHNYGHQKTGLHSITAEVLLQVLEICTGWHELGPLRVQPGLPIPLRFLGSNPAPLSRSVAGMVAVEQAAPQAHAGFTLAQLSDVVNAVMAQNMHQLRNQIREQIEVAVLDGMANFHRFDARHGSSSSVQPFVLNHEEVVDERTLVVVAAARNVTPAPKEAILDRLKTFFQNPAATFKSEAQRKMVQYSCDRVDCMIVVMATGAGKSMVWELPASYENSLTVVLVPFVAPTQNFVRRATEMGIKSHVWTVRNGVYGDCKLIFVAVKTFVTEAFAG